MKSSVAIRTAVVLAGLVFGAAATPASAAEKPQSSFSIRPVPDGRGYFVFSARPGQTITGTYRIANTGTKPGVAYLYPVDGTTGVTSGAVYLARDAARRDVGGWVRLPARRITLRPRQSKIVRFTVNVPKRARSGEHLGGIVAENAEIAGARASGGGSGLNIRIRHLSIVAVQVNVPGPRVPKLEFDGVSVGAGAGYQILYLKFGNSGNAMVKSKLSVRITGPDRRLAYKRKLDLDTFVPRTEIAFPFYVLRGSPLAPGRYELTGLLAYERRSTRFSAFFEISGSDVAEVTSPPVTTSGETETPVRESGGRWLSSLRNWTARPELLLAVGGLAAGTVLPFLVLVARRRQRVGKVPPAPDRRKHASPGSPPPRPMKSPTLGAVAVAVGETDHDVTSAPVGLERAAVRDVRAPSGISPELVLVCPELREQLLDGS